MKDFELFGVVQNCFDHFYIRGNKKPYGQLGQMPMATFVALLIERVLKFYKLVT